MMKKLSNARIVLRRCWAARPLLTGFLVIPLLLSGIASGMAQAPIATPAIDEALFKEGTIRNHEAKFDSWYAKCQEIVKVKRRICNLLSTVVDSNGQSQGSVLVATTDSGSPAMLIALTMPLAEGRSLNLKANHATKVDNKVLKIAYSHSADVARCDTTCKFIVPLDPKLTFILNAGVAITVDAPVATTSQSTKSSKKKETFAQLTIRGDGFAAALKSSTEDW